MLMRSPLQGITRHPLRAPRLPSLTQQAIAILRKFGTNAHVYIPGAGGVAVSGLTAGNYTLSDGSSGYSAIDGTAGLVLDGAGSVGADEKTYSVGATWSQAGDTFTSITTNFGSYLGIGGSANKTYRVDVTVSGGVLTQLANVTGAPLNLAQGANVVYVYATASPVRVQAAIGAVVTVNSVKEVTGIHASQSTTANKPALRRGLLNLLTYSNTFSNAAWVKTDITVANDATDSTGLTNGAWTVTEGSAGTSSLNYASTGHSGGATLSQARVVKRGNTDICRMVTASPAGNGYQCWFNLATGAKLTNGVLGTGTGSADIVPLGNGFYLLIVTATIGAADTASNNNFYCTSANNVTTRVNGATHIIERAGLFQGTLTAAQIIAEGGIPLTTSAAASNQSAGRYWWQFDGTNDSLALGSVPFQMSDDHCVIAGAITEASAAEGYIFSIGGGSAAFPMIGLLASTTGAITGRWRDDSSVAVSKSTASSAGPHVGSLRKVGNAKVVRLDGAQVGVTDNTAMGVATTTGQAIGIYGAGGSPFKGSIGPIILIKGTVSDADLLTLERWVASATPNGPSF